MNKRRIALLLAALVVSCLLVGTTGVALADEDEQAPEQTQGLPQDEADGSVPNGMSQLNAASQNDIIITLDGYTFDKDTGTILEYTGNETTLSIPSIIDGVTVSTIGERAFFSEDITTVAIPESITSVGERAFNSCSSLTSATISGSIGAEAFQNCTALTNVTLTGGVTSVADNAFKKCESLIGFNVTADNQNLSAQDGVLFNKDKTKLILYPEDKSGIAYTVPSTVTTIGNFAFYNQDTLTSVTLPAGLTTFGDQVFYDCLNIASITIPAGVSSVGSQVFSRNNSLSSVTYLGSVIGDKMFEDCCSISSFTIPDSVTTIGAAPFYSCHSISSIDVSPSSAYFTSEAGVLMSKDKRKLIQYPNGKSNASYTIPASVTSIEAGAFGRESNLTGIIFAGNITTIGDEAFYNCSNLASITLPDSVRTIGNNAFYNCEDITSFTWPTNLQSIGDSAFKRSGISSAVLPSGVTYIGENAFCDCDDLASVTIPSSVNSIGASAFKSCYALTSVLIQDGVSDISDSMFRNCTALTSITIPGGVEFIGVQAFADCAITGITIPGSVKSIGERAFEDSALVSITISDGVIVIGDRVFYDCDALTSIDIPASVVSIGAAPLYACDNMVSVVVSADNPNFSAQDNVLFNKQKTELIQYPKGLGNTEYTIPASVTTLGQYAFYACDTLTSVTMPDGLKSIGDSAFSGCTGFTSLTIPEGVTTIGDFVFYNCTSMANVTIPNSVSIIGRYTFYKCSSLTTVTLPKSLTIVDESLFRDCISLEKVILPGCVTLIDNYAFSMCPLLECVTILSSVHSIATNAFENSGSVRIYGQANSHASDYAQYNSIPFSTIAAPNVVVYTEDSYILEGSETHEISYEIDQPGIVTVCITDDSKNVVRTIEQQPYDTVGMYSVSWDGKDDGDNLMQSSSYYIYVCVENEYTLSDEEYISLTYENRTEVVRVDEIELSKDSTTLTVGQTDTFVTTLTPQDATYSHVTWTVNDSSVAEVDGVGKVTAKALGVTLITATADGVSASGAVIVKKQSPAVTMSNSTKTMTVGNTATLSATLTPSEADISWSSSDTDVATVDDNGTVTAVSEGVTVIIADADGAYDVCGISVDVPAAADDDDTDDNGGTSGGTTVGSTGGTTGGSSGGTTDGDTNGDDGSGTTPTQSADGEEPMQSAVEDAVDVPDAGDDTMSIMPQTVEQSSSDPEIVLVRINANDLPEGTTSVQMGNGDIVEIGEDGIVQLEIRKDDLNSDGVMEIVALDSEGTPLGMVDVQVAPQTNSDKSGMTGFIWLLIGFGGAGVITVALYFLLIKKRLA